MRDIWDTRGQKMTGFVHCAKYVHAQNYVNIGKELVRLLPPMSQESPIGFYHAAAMLFFSHTNPHDQTVLRISAIVVFVHRDSDQGGRCVIKVLCDGMYELPSAGCYVLQACLDHDQVKCLHHRHYLVSCAYSVRSVSRLCGSHKCKCVWPGNGIRIIII